MLVRNPTAVTANPTSSRRLIAYVIHVWQRCRGAVLSKRPSPQTIWRARIFSDAIHGNGTARRLYFCYTHSCPPVPPAITVGQSGLTNSVGMLVLSTCPTIFRVFPLVIGMAN